jgi:YHS domain-containing protein
MDTNKQAICPVMKSPIDKKVAEEKGLMREYNGEKYYLCCAGCGPLFDKDPTKYVGINENTNQA